MEKIETGFQPIEGLAIFPLEIKYSDLGPVMMGLKKSDIGFHGFGEAYFSIVFNRKIKGWNCHKRSTSNFIVPTGKIKFVFYDLRDNSKTKGNFYELIVSRKDYVRIAVPPNIWIAFSGLAKPESVLLNISNCIHDPDEMEKKSIDQIPFDWSNS